MAISVAKYLGKARVETTHLASGQKVVTDAVKEYGGQGEYPTPVEVLAQSLANCALTVLALRGMKEGVDITGSYAEIGECEENMENHSVSKFNIVFHIKGNVEEGLRKKLEMFAHKGCFVGNTLTAEKNFTFIYE
ncbi:MAG: OsmC family protein [Prevotella sp.]|uniref:OsmC family protein n=1 Tax=Prevotella sp. TaxID=59823 RepID=UPI002A29ED04|nr:OsmC family protein [Prevotella sp.]MDD7317552.1 OsmC family protein [Prevotellaceae bacterium]MDY4020601.1 OsmC family protein [Prevotella sp.]